MSDYKWDVFISYCHQSAVSQWVKNHFHLLLKDYLDVEIRWEPKIFWDRTGLAPGDHFPEKLRDALLHTRCMVAVWTPQYLESHWCQIEWHTMLARKAHIQRAGKKGDVLLPVLYSDGKDYESWPDGSHLIYEDFKPFAHHHPQYQEAPDFHRFMSAIQQLAVRLAEWIKDAEPWTSKWRVIDRVVTVPKREVKLQRL